MHKIIHVTFFEENILFPSVQYGNESKLNWVWITCQVDPFNRNWRVGTLYKTSVWFAKCEEQIRLFQYLYAQCSMFTELLCVKTQGKLILWTVTLPHAPSWVNVSRCNSLPMRTSLTRTWTFSFASWTQGRIRDFRRRGRQPSRRRR